VFVTDVILFLSEIVQRFLKNAQVTKISTRQLKYKQHYSATCKECDKMEIEDEVNFHFCSILH
jgi:hypothetical protein